MSFATQVVNVDPFNIDSSIIAQASALIRAGQLVAFPTETVYGLGANALDQAAVDRIFRAKGRPTTDPVIVHVQSPGQLGDVTPDVSPLAQTLIERFWPGPLTLVLPRGSRVPPNVSAGLPTVAVRMPAHPIALALIKAAGVPIAAPSANRFAHTSPTTAQHVFDDLSGNVPLILDGGPTTVGVESTIVDLSGDHPRLLRPGGTPLDALRRFAPEVEAVARYVKLEDGAVPAPGMLLKHYSPRAELRLFEGPDDKLRQTILETATALQEQGRQVGLLVALEDQTLLTGLGCPLVSLGSLHDLDEIARHLFAGLRDLDAQGVDVILARSYPHTGIGLAIRDRLIRAAEGYIIQV
ncbi:MAG: threonylcarbamoyl-AMP synthase [Anaerolineae bacterium]|nr:threonylcarbamoyl-AMP synthase [Anaerolineae bacterium]